VMMRSSGVVVYSSLGPLGPVVGVIVGVVWQWTKNKVGARLVVVVDLVHNIIFSPR